MRRTYFFYDVETSGTDTALQRIMQFAGIRTDTELKPVGEPVNWLVKLSEDVLPEPEAILVHGITPQKTLEEGITEAELSARLMSEVFTPGTVAIGFNNIRFDDEFVRNLFWRNFYDPYKWHYADERSRWDLLDATRMMRALRPDGLNWPVDEEGKPTNRLGALASANKIALEDAHDALADIGATVELARLVRQAQPKLFDFLLELRDKKRAEKVVKHPQGFVYTSGRHPGEHLKTTHAYYLAESTLPDSSLLVFDLRHDPRPWLDMSAKELAKRIYVSREEREQIEPLPVKKLALNRAPAAAPLITLDEASQKRLKLDLKTTERHRQHLEGASQFIKRVQEAFAAKALPARQDPEARLYESFPIDADRDRAAKISSATPAELAELQPKFADERLNTLFWRYKARNFPQTLTDSEQSLWEGWRLEKLTKGIDHSLTYPDFYKRLEKLAQTRTDTKAQFLLEELKLYGESIAPPQLF